MYILRQGYCITLLIKRFRIGICSIFLNCKNTSHPHASSGMVWEFCVPDVAFQLFFTWKCIILINCTEYMYTLIASGYTINVIINNTLCYWLVQNSLTDVDILENTSISHNSVFLLHSLPGILGPGRPAALLTQSLDWVTWYSTPAS